jgi:glycosyltransferase involved in cell wall biosynthesis
LPFDEFGKWKDPVESDVQRAFDEIAGKKEAEIPDSLKGILEELVADYAVQTTHYNVYDSINEAIKGGIGEVDIVIPVYGGLHVLKPCIDSIIKHTRWPYNLILVNDSTPDGGKTAKYLEQLTNATVLTNKKNRGFPATVNRGIKAGSGKYICILNSDVLVTPKWLTKMVLAIESHHQHQIINPITNNTALISVPMKPGASYLDMNRALEIISQRKYPEAMPTGFCFFIRRSLIGSLGYLDEGYASGYGEDSALWIDTMKFVKPDGSIPRYKAVLADDTYLFHERSGSFAALGDDQQMGHRQHGSQRFRKLYPEWKYWSRRINLNRALRPLKREFPPGILKPRRSKYSIAWVVKTAGMCGGMLFVTDIVNALIEQGVDAKVVCVKQDKNDPEDVIQELRTQPIFFDDWESCAAEFGERVFDEGIVVASTGELVKLVSLLKKTYPKLTTLHHVQSDDVAIAPDDESAKKQEECIGRLDHTVVSSQWLANKIAPILGDVPKVVVPGVNTDIFYPRGRAEGAGDDRPTLMMPMINTYPYKGYDRGVDLINYLFREAKEDIRVLVYGTDFIPEARDAVGLGILSQTRLAELLGSEVDVFCDPSHIHSYGMPALEAIASGVFTVSWDNKGVKEYNVHKIVSAEASVEEVGNVILDALGSCTRYPTGPPEGHERKTQVEKFIKYLDSLAGVSHEFKNIVVVTPHMRKYGGPTTIINTANELKARGHKVTLSTVYTDINPRVLDLCKVPVDISWNKLRSCDVAIVNSDNDKAQHFFDMPQVKKRVMLKLSHNPRFKILEDGNLTLPWDHIMTSSEWLRQACIKPHEGWEHPPWPEDKVTRVGWINYDHSSFDKYHSRTWGTKEGQVTICFLFHTHPSKGTNDSIAMVADLKNTYPKDVHVMGVGEMHIKGVPKWIQYHALPTRNELANIMGKTDIWVSSSYTEGLGRMNLEAMSAGCAIVATDTGAEFLTHGENSLLFPVGDIEAGKNCVEQLFADEELAMRLRERAYATAAMAADPGGYIRNIERVLEEL